MGFNSFCVLNAVPWRSSCYFNDDHYLNQTRQMMDENNILKSDCFMHVDLTELSTSPKTYSAKIYFEISGYKNINNLEFTILDKNQLNSSKFVDYDVISSGSNESYLSVASLDQSTYEVCVYDKVKAGKKKKVCKAEFCVTSK